MEKIFLYTTNQEKKREIFRTAQTLGIPYQEIAPIQLSCSIGYIIGMTDQYEKDTGVPMFYNMPEVMLFSGFEGDRLDVFLRAYRQNKIEPVPLKAVVTPSNCSWSLYQLVEELKKERALLSRR